MPRSERSGRDFAELVEPHRRELLLHCYRMLGSLTDAEDALQETLVAAWKGHASFEGRSSLRTWLYRIATNRCLNVRRDAGRRIPVPPVPPFEPPEPTRRDAVTWLQPCPDALLDGVPDAAPGPEARYGMKEAVELAFITALQRLPPRQAAVLILRDVLGYSVAETADLLTVTPTVVKGLLQRARSAAGHPRSASPDERLVQRFAEAFTAGDVDTVVGLLVDDAWLTMPPAPHEYQGRAAIGAFLRASNAWRGPRRLRLEERRVNTQPAYACHLDGESAGLMVLTLSPAGIAGLTRFLTWAG